MTTTTVESAPVTVDALFAAPPLVNLVGACQALGTLTELDEAHWGFNGARWLPENDAAPPTDQVWWDCFEAGGAGPVGTKERETPGDIVRVRPFDIYRTLGVSGLQHSAEDWRARARRRLVAAQSHMIEAEVWDGTIAQAAAFPNPYLRQATLLNGGAALGYRRALAELEEAVASAGGVAAMIHVNWRLASLWSNDGLATPAPSGKYLRTALGTIVVPGTGYPGTGAQASGVAKAYAYVTPLVRMWLGPIREYTLEAAGTTAAFDVDPDVNDITVRVERSVVYGWDDGPLAHGIYADLASEH